MNQDKTPGPPPVDDPNQPVTVVVTRRIRPGSEAGFEDWLKGVTGAASRYEGHQGVSVIRPRDRANPEYVLIFRFDNYFHLRRWVESEERQEWMKRGAPYFVDDPRVQMYTGLEAWFSLPDAPAAPPAPPRYKTAIVTACTIYPLITGLNLALGGVLGQLPVPLRMLVMIPIMTVLMTYVIMPQVTRLTRRWLYVH